MNNSTKQILQQANDAVQKAVDSAKMQRNEEDRKYILAALGKDLIFLLEPFLHQIAENSKITREELKKIISEIKLEPPQVSVAPPKVNVTTPEVRVPDIKIPEIKIPIIKVPEPKVTVNVPEIKVPKAEIKMPSEMKVEGGVELKGIDRDKPLPVILTDEKGVFYKAIANLISQGGGGGGGVVEIKKTHGATGINGGTKTAAAAGTPEQITSTSRLIRRVWIQALGTNTSTIVIGGKDVDETPASRNGLALFATQGQWFDVSDLSLIWIDVAVNGEGVHYLYEV